MADDPHESYDASKVAPAATAPEPEPRYGSLYEGSDGQRAQMRAVVYYNRKRRIARQG